MKILQYALLLICFVPLFAAAQQKTITGKVTDAQSSQPLSGVTVASGTGRTSVVTNNEGNYSITIPQRATQLIFSYVGMKPVTENIGTRSVIDVSMSAADSSLENVVVVGYGTQKKATLTGSVSVLKSSEIVVTKNESVVNMLTGKIPGLRMVQRTAEPGGYENTYDIRGFGSAPLVVIDGVPRGGFEKMDPNEIESISVLKDAAAAVYGVRAANGVILITTKKGNRNGKFDINYSVNLALQQFLGMPEGVGPLDFMMLSNEKAKRAFANNFISNVKPAYSYEDMLPWMEGRFQATDWIGSTFNKTAPQVQHNLNISGGTDKASYFFNVGYMKQDGVLKTNDINYNRYNFRSNINLKITNGLRAQALVSGHIDEKYQPYQEMWTLFKYTWSMIPIKQAFANGNPLYPSVIDDNANPLVITDADKVGFRKRTQKNIQAQLSLEYDIPYVKGLKARGMFNYGYNIDDNSEYKKSYTLYTYEPDLDVYHASTVNNPPNLLRQYYNNQSTLSQLGLNYANTFAGDHNVTAMALFEESYSKGDNIFASRNMLLPVDYLFGGEDEKEKGSTYPNGVSEVVTQAVVGRATYDFRGKYLAEFTFRYDGSNKYKPGANQWGFFPGFFAGWVVSREPWFDKLVNPKYISNLKIRGSYGITGDDGTTGFQYIDGFNYPTINPNDNSIYGYLFNGQFIKGSAMRDAVNPNLTWFTAHTSNIGLEFTTLNGKLDVVAEVYRRDRKGLPARKTVAIPGTAGIELAQENLDSDRTQGWELQLTHRNRINDFGINITGNFSQARTQMLDVIQGRAGNEFENWKSQRSNRFTNIWWGKDYAGQFTSYEQIYNHKVNTGGGNNNVIPGDYYYQDWNEDGVIDGRDDHPIATRDIPLVNFGLTIGVTWKGIDFSALFAGVTGVNIMYEEQFLEPLMYDRSALTQFLNSWHTVNPDDNVFDPNTKWVPGKYPAMGSPKPEGTKAVQDGSYVRLKSIELGYTLPQSLLKRISMKNCRFYVNAYNLLTFTKLRNSDPEHPGQQPDAGFQYGLGGYKYPLNRTFNVGASITF
ncbi:SusC/RagA family TonB-linked outer membrane protein [Pseudobacter ginsenosidimutans]|uniref:TonB-linked SusC/RagA family outer membrane protein n=1 Tax=Pseudobacter ginsenosidimutans TaxID=661488 RepID=A0A4Q7MNL7_9BACT|nr:TonB-dependent receptor [Pseudobacter ginsenosidimutans]QEC45772.1 TonB-dependent receptor [Pseudobacter ginsenosidimutans]RZS69283.1 TonB-linked SusC/RagA family outer membrane protein [Pseudobacter ginsenosidimutans]